MQLHITVGDPLGIGPEIVLLSLSRLTPSLPSPPRVYGHGSILKKVAERLEIALPPMDLVEPRAPLDPEMLPGKAQVSYLEAALDSILADIDEAVLVTAPICKEAARSGGLEFPGHTEYLAHKAGAERVAMMMAGPRLKVILATTHIPLTQVAPALAQMDLAGLFRLACISLKNDFGIEQPTLAVAGLNPHAGEGGAFGDEEARLLTPAIQRAQRHLQEIGLQARLTGPHPPDTLFWKALQGGPDAVLALYHDQGLIASKILDLHDTVNVTLGLPFIRTSPDHGVAYDLVGTGEAKPDSFTAAVRLGAEMHSRRHGTPRLFRDRAPTSDPALSF